MFRLVGFLRIMSKLLIVLLKIDGHVRQSDLGHGQGCRHFPCSASTLSKSNTNRMINIQRQQCHKRLQFEAAQ
jgi:hypothetical protein